MLRHLSRTIVAVLLLLTGWASPAAETGVILMYHHVADDTPQSTSIAPAVFAEQLAFLERDNFNVVPLIDLLDGLESKSAVADRSVAITFDDAYLSVLTEALPLLQSRGWPFTVFVNTEAIDSGYGGYLSWDELRLLAESGASIGNHSVTHSHLVRRLAGETASGWRQRVTEEISVAADRLQAELGDYLIPAFAYPYGEYTVDVKAIVQALGLYGLGQQSGAVGYGSDFLALPRYPVATGLALADYALRVRSLPLPVTLVGDERHILDAVNDGRPALRLALDSVDDIRTDELACYASGQGRMPLAWRGDTMREFVTRPVSALGTGRSKVNCTAPSRAMPGVYYWYGHLWMRGFDDGRWYDE